MLDCEAKMGKEWVYSVTPQGSAAKDEHFSEAFPVKILAAHHLDLPEY